MALFFNRQPPKVIWANRSRARRIWVNRQFAFQDEVVATISAHTAQVVLPGSYFSTADWANPLLRKRVVITNGAHVWSYTQGVPALDLGTGRQGDLYVDIDAGAYVLGHAGAQNSGVGGTAIKVRQNQCWITYGGGIYGGGGGGGRGGQGGPGVWYSGRTVTEGPLYTKDYYCFISGSGHVIWEGVSKGNIGNGGSDGTWNYYQGAYAESQNFASYYYVYRSRVIYDIPNYTSGGAGGNGGKGTGYNSSLVSEGQGGFAGSAGGTNAGAGGSGGAGGGWGAQGATGNTGAAGNNGAGVAGTAGGLGGLYIDGIANVNALTKTGSGLLLGRVA